MSVWEFVFVFRGVFFCFAFRENVFHLLLKWILFPSIRSLDEGDLSEEENIIVSNAKATPMEGIMECQCYVCVSVVSSVELFERDLLKKFKNSHLLSWRPTSRPCLFTHPGKHIFVRCKLFTIHFPFTLCTLVSTLVKVDEKASTQYDEALATSVSLLNRDASRIATGWHGRRS